MNDIAKYKNQGKCMVIGDMNGHTNTVSDENVFDSENDGKTLPLPPSFSYFQYMPRRNQDTRPVNKRGKDIIQLCKSCDLRIVNGRKLGDLTGKFTCYEVNAKTPSVIDYVLAEKNAINDILYFYVKDLNIFSDHCPIVTKLKSTIPMNCITNEENHVLNPHQKSYLWEPQVSDEAFKIALRMPLMKQKLSEIKERLYNPNSLSIERAVDDITKCILTIADTAKIKQRIHKVRKKRSKKRKRRTLSADCYALTRRVKTLCRQVCRNPFDRGLRQLYYAKEKMLKRKLKDIVRNERNQIIDKLENLHNENPRIYWNLIKDLENLHTERKRPEDNIKPNIWSDYFKNLMNKNLKLNSEQDENKKIDRRPHTSKNVFILRFQDNCRRSFTVYSKTEKQ